MQQVVTLDRRELADAHDPRTAPDDQQSSSERDDEYAPTPVPRTNHGRPL
jgi:hypothetical protein